MDKAGCEPGTTFTPLSELLMLQFHAKSMMIRRTTERIPANPPKTRKIVILCSKKFKRYIQTVVTNVTIVITIGTIHDGPRQIFTIFDPFCIF